MAACVTCIFAVTLSVFPVITVKVETFYTNYIEWSETWQRSASYGLHWFTVLHVFKGSTLKARGGFCEMYNYLVQKSRKDLTDKY